MALDALRAYRDRGCTLPPPPSPATVREMMSFIVGEEVPGRVRADDARGDGARRRRRARRRVGRRAARSGARASASSSSAPACRACSRRSGSSRRASRTSSSRRTTASAARGSRTAIPAAASTSPTTSTATRSSRTTTGPSSSRSATSCATTSSAAPSSYGVRERHPLRHRGRRGALGRAPRALGSCGCVRPTARGDARRQRGHQRRRAAQPPAHARHPRTRRRSPGRRSTPREWQHQHEPRGQARRGDRHRRERVPARARGRQGGEPAHRVPALAAVDGAEPALPRARQRGEEVAAAPRARTTGAGIASCSSGRARTA